MASIGPKRSSMVKLLILERLRPLASIASMFLPSSRRKKKTEHMGIEGLVEYRRYRRPGGNVLDFSALGASIHISSDSPPTLSTLSTIHMNDTLAALLADPEHIPAMEIPRIVGELDRWKASLVGKLAANLSVSSR